MSSQPITFNLKLKHMLITFLCVLGAFTVLHWLDHKQPTALEGAGIGGFISGLFL